MPLPPHDDNDINNNDHALNSYRTLLTHLHPSPPTVLEIDILPSSSGPEIQYCSTDRALGIPKRSLIAAFLVARGLFFRHLSSGHGSVHTEEERGDTGEEEIFNATTMILLLDPNHTTAINFRKRYICYLLQRASSCSSAAGSNSYDDIDVVVTRELIWLESLLTSPLPKHTKSPTLWAHRAWLLRTFLLPNLKHRKGRRVVGEDDSGMPEIREEGGGEHGGSDDGRRLVLLVEMELAVVMRAGERHPRNYYGWHYAREVCGMFKEVEILDEREEAAGGAGGRGGWRRGMVEKVRGWCFLHPRDVSGWSFLAWLLEEQMNMSGCVERGEAREDMVENIVIETEAFVAKYEWRGQSIEWFLKAVRRLKTSK